MKTEEQFSSSDKSENITMGVVMSILPFLFFLPLVMDDKKYSPYCKFRANQCLITFIVMAVLNAAAFIIGLALGFIPLIGSLAGLVCNILKIVSLLYYLQNLIFAIMGSGKRVFIAGELDLIS
ncbi:MAG: hypothetical protein NC120_09475 [Ruminococcus sp.]|nr:hypothetical protein [Ruminococcus sp.]